MEHEKEETREQTKEEAEAEKERKEKEKEEEAICEEEERHFREVIESFLGYGMAMHQWITMKERDWHPLSQSERVPLSLRNRMPQNFERLHQAVDANSKFLKMVVNPHNRPFESQDLEQGYNVVKKDGHQHGHGSSSLARYFHSSAFQRNYDKVKSTFSQLVRDWADEGEEERNSCYKPIVEEIDSYFHSVPRSKRADIRVLCPGSGLGRLPWEIAMKGFGCQGNDFSYQMLLASNHIFNCCDKDSVTIFPYIHTNSNHANREDQLRSVTVPNVKVANEDLSKEFSTNAGEFLEIYSSDLEEWDCLSTCFFLDTAKNAVEYIRTFYEILKPGGCWVNLGPLLYHYEDMSNEISIEFSFDEILMIIKEVGFEILKIEERSCTYTRDSLSMMHLTYPRCQFFVCAKPHQHQK